MRNWLRTLLFVSAFSPALITMAYVRYDLYGWRVDVCQLLIIGILGTLIPLAIVQLVRSHGEVFVIHVKKIESNDFMLLTFVGSYMLPLISRGAEVSANSIFVLLFIAAAILWLVNYVPAHPLLRVFKFKFYKLESSAGMVYTLISKRNIRDPKEVKMVVKLSETMLMEEMPGV